MAIYNPLTENEIQDGAPIDEALFEKVKDNFENHEARLVTEEMDVNVVRAYQIIIDDAPGLYDAENIETALMEVMAKVNTNQATNQATLGSQSSALSSLEDRTTTLEAHDLSHDNRISNNESNISALNGTILSQGARLTTVEGSVSTNTSSINLLTGRLATAEGNISGNANNITGLTVRLGTAESTILANGTTIGNNTTAIASNTDQLSMTCFMIDKAKFLNKCVINTGAVPTYSANPSSNNTGLGAILSTAVNQEITYNTFIPVSGLMGMAANAIILIPTGATITFGVKCYTSAQVLIQNVNIANAVSSTGAFQLLEGHLMTQGTGATNFPVGTRFVKPFISWTNNTGTVIFDYMSCVPLGYARYAILG